MPTVRPNPATLTLTGSQVSVALTIRPAPASFTVLGHYAAVSTGTDPITVEPSGAVLTGIGHPPEIVTPITPLPATLVVQGHVGSVATTVVDASAGLLEQCEQIWEATRRLRREEDALRREQPLVRIWDAEWDLQHLLSVDYKSTWAWISNDSGPGQTELPMDSPVAEYIKDMQGRIDRGEGRNIHVTVDYCGARWSGRYDKFSIEQREDGDIAMVVDWLHDYEHLKWYQCWSNPFL